MEAWKRSEEELCTSVRRLTLVRAQHCCAPNAQPHTPNTRPHTTIPRLTFKNGSLRLTRKRSCYSFAFKYPPFACVQEESVAYRDLREFVRKLEKEGELTRVRDRGGPRSGDYRNHAAGGSRCQAQGQ